MKITISKNKIFTFLILTIFFDSYRIGAIGNRDFTLWYFGAALLFLFSLLKFSDVIIGIKKNPFALAMVVYMILNFMIEGQSGVMSLLIGIVCWMFYIASYRKSSVASFENTINLFQNGMNILAIYGIYQLIANVFGLPFRNPWIEGFMVDGYNWGNNISIGGVVLRRSNAVFREPSYFSQFLAINMLIYFQKIIGRIEKSSKEDGKNIKWIIMNGIAMLCSFSGTGLLMFGMGSVILVLSNNIKLTLRFIYKHKILVFLIIAFSAIIIIVPNQLTTYLLSRTSEFDSTNTFSISGYLRMVLPYQAAYEIVRYKNTLFGIGIGNASSYVMMNGYSIGYNMQPIIPRTFAEEGIIGGLLLLGFAIKLWKKENITNNSYKAILIGTFLMSFMHGTWSSEVYWLLLGLLNLNLLDKDGRV